MSDITAERPTGSSQSTTEQVKERVQEVAEQAKGTTRESLRTQVDSRSAQLGEQVTATSNAMRTMAHQLRSEQNDAPAKIIEQINERAERLGKYLTESSGDRILRDVEGFARRRPWVAGVAGALTGFIGSRFVKASSSRRFTAGHPPLGGQVPSPSRRVAELPAQAGAGSRTGSEGALGGGLQ